MVVHMKKPFSAYKHGGYTATAVSPGESGAEFEKLHRDNHCRTRPRWRPRGRCRCEHCAADLAQATSPTFRLVERAKRRHQQLVEEALPVYQYPHWPLRWLGLIRFAQKSKSACIRAGPQRVCRSVGVG